MTGGPTTTRTQELLDRALRDLNSQGEQSPQVMRLINMLEEQADTAEARPALFEDIKQQIGF